MKKNLIALAVAATMVPAIAAAEGASVSGHNIIKLKSDDDKAQFSAATEIDFRSTTGAVTVGADIDFNLAPGGGSADLEQAFFAYGATEDLTVIGGLFNNPIGMEANDDIDWSTTHRSMAGAVLDFATAASGNNIAGLAGAYNAGVATVTVALINDTGNKEADTIALVVNAAPMENLNVEFGYLNDGAGGLDTSLWDLNATMDLGAASVSVEIMDVDLGASPDPIIGLSGTFKVNDATKVSARYDMSSSDNAGLNAMTGIGESELSLAAWYAVEENLTAGLGYNTVDTGATTDESLIIKFKATF